MNAGIWISAAISLCSFGGGLCCSEAAAETHIRIGVSAPLSGDLAEYGGAVRNGIELAKSESPGQFAGLEFLFEDNQYDASKAISAFNKLVDADSVDLVFNWGEPTLGAIAPLAERRGIPVLAMSLDRKPAEGNSFVLLTINYAEQYAKKLVEYFRAKKLRKLGIMLTEDPFLNSMVQGIREQLRDGESVEVFAAFKPGDADFKTQIVKLKRAGFDAVGIYLFSGQVSAFFRQAKALGLKTQFFGTDFFESRTEIEQAGGAMEGAVYPNLSVPAGFLSRYRSKFGNEAQIAYAYNAYQFALTSAAVFGAGTTPLQRREIIPRYLNVSRAGIFTIGETPGGAKFFEFPLVMRQIQNGGFVSIE